MKNIAVILLFVSIACSISVFDVVQEEWNAFKVQHGKEYLDEVEERFRMKIFMENKHKIALHNQRYERGEVTFKLGLNKYADMLHQEFVQIMNGYNRTTASSRFNRRMEQGVTFISPANVVLPRAIDWRSKGAVTPVKDQGRCGSCWAFSSTGSLEGQHFRRSGNLVSLSEQNLIDCSGSYGNEGCEGGEMENSFRYIKENGGINTEKSYPYEATEDSCHFDKHTIGATDKGFVQLPPGDEQKLKEALATIGPMSVAVDASHDSFQFYTDGVYFEPSCDPEQLGHAVLAVGYGTDKNGVDYWLVKNSWGTTWGDEGYIKMARNRENHCGIASGVTYPLV